MSRLQELIRKLCPNKVEYKKLGKHIELYTGNQFNKRDMLTLGLYPVINGGVNPSGFANIYNQEANSITISQGGASAGYVNWMDCRFYAGAHCYIVKPKTNLNNRYLYFCLKNNEKYLTESKHGAGIPALNKSKIQTIEIPIPPLAVQEEIVKILDLFTDYISELQAELQARQEQYKYYRNLLLNFKLSPIPSIGMDCKITWKTLGEICINLDRKRKPIIASSRNPGQYPYYGASGIVDYVVDYIFDGEYLLISEDGANLLTRSTPIAFMIRGKNWVNNHAHVLEFENTVTLRFVKHYINMIDISKYVSGGAQPKLNQKNLNSILIPILPIEIQEKIVTILDSFEVLINDLSQGLPAEINAVQKQYEYYRNKLLSFSSNRIIK